MSFVHLHLLSEYSLLQSALRLEELPGLAAAAGMKYLALTDHMNMSGAVRFYDSCMEKGVLPILGVEASLEPLAPEVWRELALEQGGESRAAMRDGAAEKTMDVVLLAKNNEGYRTICRWLSRAGGPEGHFREEWLKEAKGNVVLLTGGVRGEVFGLLEKDRRLEAAKVVGRYLEYFGRGNVFLEIQWHGLESQRLAMPRLVELGKSLGIPLAAANECRYARREDAGVLELLRAIGQGRSVSSVKELAPACNQIYFRSEEEMRAICKNIPEACDNTFLIADMCHVELNPEHRIDLPKFPLEKGERSEEVLRAKAMEGLKRLYGDCEDRICERLEYELSVICEMGFADYFLIVADYVNFAKKEGIPVGPGRGSAVGSLVAYALGITEIDPLKYDLYFERFLNPNRRKMPDIDMDFCERRRGEVISYIRRRYGEDKVAQVATFSTLRSKAALQDCARVLGADSGIVDKIASLVDRYSRDANLKTGLIAAAMNGSEGLKRLIRDTPESLAKVLCQTAGRVEDLPRNVSLHAAAVVISPAPICERVPLMGLGEEARTQCDMYAVERMGLLKMDVLGLRTLTIMEDMRSIASGAFEYANIPMNDEEALALIGRGETIGVFQLESEGMKRVLKRLKPRDFKDIIAVLALYRPGPMQNLDSFVARHNGEEKIEFIHPKLESVLGETCGIMLYQEQVMRSLNVLLGYSMGEADTFRQIMSKKKMAMMAKERSKFLERAGKKKIPAETAEKLFSDIASFAGYGFNKSHAAAYAMLSYRMAYVKAHYPAVFAAGLLNAHQGDLEYAARLMLEMRGMNFSIEAPDVNRSTAWHSASMDAQGHGIMHYGLAGVKGVPEKLALAAVEEREKGGVFTSLDNFCLRLDRRLLQPQAVVALIKSGAFDFTGQPRALMALLAQDLLDSRGESALQRSFFSVKNPVEASEWPDEEKLRYEQEVLGLYLSKHPLEPWRDFWRGKVTLMASELPLACREEGKLAVMGGTVLSIKKRTSRQGGTYAVLRIEDFSGIFEAMLWDETCRTYLPSISVGDVWFLKGRIREGAQGREGSIWVLAMKRYSKEGQEMPIA